MAQRHSGYKREWVYNTPSWVTEALLPHIPERVKTVWEPAAGIGRMSGVLSRHYTVVATDLKGGIDFLSPESGIWQADAVITNPPWGRGYGYPEIGQLFAQRALEVTKEQRGFVAMLFPMNYDCADTRRYLFADCPQFAKKIVLTKRIIWFEREDGKKAAPSENHSWFLWDWRHKGAPVTAYAP